LRTFVGNGEATHEISQIVQTIIEDVKARGDIAVLYHTARLDHAKLNIRQIRVSEEHLKKAFETLSAEKKRI
jgi:histidinol dehydrogenase